MKGKKDLWFRVGEAMERVLQAVPGVEEPSGPRRKGSRSAPKRGRRRGKGRKGQARSGGGARLLGLLDRDGGGLDELARSPLAGLAAAGTGTMALRLVRRWTDQRRPPMSALLGAAGAGAGAALLRELVLTALDRDQGGDTGEALVGAVLNGASEGLVYASLMEPFLPDSTLLQGSILGAAGFAAAPYGGVAGVFRPLSPHRSIPLLGSLLEAAEDAREDRSLVEHLVYGLAVALVYRKLVRARSSKGMDDEE
jgi:hypothetical protein